MSDNQDVAAATMTDARSQARRTGFSWVEPSSYLLTCVVFGLLSAVLGPDNNWDLRYYHLYAPWAYLHDRYLYDIAPAQLQGFFNPTIDFLFYALVTSPLNDFPRVVAFIMGAVHGVNAALVLAIVRQVITPEAIVERRSLRTAAFLIGATGAGYVSLVGLTTGDLINSIFILAALLSLLNVAGREPATSALPGFARAGLFAGIGFGLKYTAVTFMPGIGLVALLAAARRRTLSGVVVFGAMLLVGFLLAAGHHMFVLWNEFGNPLFPTLNNVFQSPFYDAASLRDPQFLPRSFLQAIAYPFYWTVRNVYLVTELPFRDWRGAMAYLAIIAWVAMFLTRCAREKSCKSPSSRDVMGLGLVTLFVVVSYFGWALGFSIYRYAVVLELLTGVIVIGALVAIVHSLRLRLSLAALLVVIAVATTQFVDWGRGYHASDGIRPAPYAEKYIDVRVPPIPPHSIVLLATDQPAAYFIPYAEPTARYLGLENNMLKLAQDNRLVAEIKHLMRTPGPRKFIVSVGDYDAAKLNGILRNFDLKLSAEPCQPIVSNLEEHPLSICPASPL